MGMFVVYGAVVQDSVFSLDVLKYGTSSGAP